MLEPMDLPPIWNVPYRRNEFFTGREDILTHLIHAQYRCGIQQKLPTKNGSRIRSPSGREKGGSFLPLCLMCSLGWWEGGQGPPFRMQP
jgi:hypothetical protein